jgi:Icc-related predicted phosphoesterase
MKTILILTDFHDSKHALRGLDALLARKQYDAIISLGDVINPRPAEFPYVKAYVETIQKYKIPFFGLHGNNEPQMAWEYYRQAEINIHLENRQWDGYNICGIGGFGYLNETGFEDLSIQNLIINQKTIFVTHVPPRVSEAQRHGPLVHLYGHRHSLAFTKKMGETLLVQCPAGILGRVTELDLPSLEVRFVNIF